MISVNAFPNVDDRPMWDLWMSSLQFSVVVAAEELGVFGHLKQKGLATDPLALKVGLSSEALAALLRVLWAMKFIEYTEGEWELNPLSGAYCLSTSAFSWSGIFAAQKSRSEYVRLVEGLQGKRRLHSRGSEDTISEAWTSGKMDPDTARAFTAAMHSHTFGAAVGAARSGCFAYVENLLDVGGGSGCFCIALASQYPATQYTVFELPAVAELTKSYIKKAGLTKSIKVRAGNFFTDEWPQGHDGALFSHIFHDWPRARCLELARKAFKALTPGGRIFIHEILLNEEGPGPLAAACFSLLMHINHGTRQFTASEVKDLLIEAGFQVPVHYQTLGYNSVIAAEKPELELSRDPDPEPDRDTD